MASCTAMWATKGNVKDSDDAWNRVITPPGYMSPLDFPFSPGSESGSQPDTKMPFANQFLSRNATKIEYRRLGIPPQDKIKPSSYASMHVTCTLYSDIAVKNTKLGSLRQLSVFGF